jgi:hypothetical protein
MTAFLIIGVVGMLVYKLLIGVTPLWLDGIAVAFCLAFVVILKFVSSTESKMSSRGDR